MSEHRLVNDIDWMLRNIKDKQKQLKCNEELFEIYEGDLEKFVDIELQKEFASQTYLEVIQRLAPINLLQRLIDKLSKIYQQEPARHVIPDTGSDSDSDLLSWYEGQMSVNKKLNISNEFFNLYKNVLIEPFVHEGVPRLRSIRNDRFIVLSDDKVDPLNVTHVVILADTEVSQDSVTRNPIYWAYTDEEFIIFDGSKKHRLDLQMRLEVPNPESVNPVGKIPFVYVNQSDNLLMPLLDSDTKRMVTLIPRMLADLNYMAKYSGFPLTIITDADDQNFIRAPNSVWILKSDKTAENPPKVEVITPTADIEKQMGLIRGLISFWLQSKGIKPGAIGDMKGESFASGISKIIDEMDTVELRREQVMIFSDAEGKDLWPLITQHLHPHWVATNQIEQTALFSATVEIETNFSEQLPIVSRGQIVSDLKAEQDAGYTTRKRAIKKLNPRMSDSEVEALIEEIDADNTVEIEPSESTSGTTGEGGATPETQHTHGFEVDEQGNGQTTTTGPGAATDHVHQISNFDVMFTDHDHSLNEVETE